MRGMNRYMWDGSYTVEAAFIVPMVLGIMYAWMFQLFYLHDQMVMDGMLQEMIFNRWQKKELTGKRSSMTGKKRYRNASGSQRWISWISNRMHWWSKAGCRHRQYGTYR